MPFTYKYPLADTSAGDLAGSPSEDAPLTGSIAGGADTVAIYPSGRVVAKDGVETFVKASAPVDGDFATVPADGTVVIGNDATNDCIYVRVGGVWKKATLA